MGGDPADRRLMNYGTGIAPWLNAMDTPPRVTDAVALLKNAFLEDPGMRISAADAARLAGIDVNCEIELIVEWRPRLQEAAGYADGALPEFLLDHGFRLDAASHARVTRLNATEISALAARLRRRGRPVELVA